MASLPLMLLSSVKRKSEATVRDSDGEPVPPTKLKNRSTVVHNEDGKPKQLFRKRKSISQIDDDDDEESYPPRKKVAVTSAKGEPRKKQSKRDEDFEMEESSFEEEDDDEFIDDEEDDVKPQGRRKYHPRSEQWSLRQLMNRSPRWHPSQSVITYRSDDLLLILIPAGSQPRHLGLQDHRILAPKRFQMGRQTASLVFHLFLPENYPAFPEKRLLISPNVSEGVFLLLIRFSFVDLL